MIQPPAPLPFWEVKGSKKFQACNHMVGSPGNSPPSLVGAFQNHFINITKDTFITLITKNSKGFKSSVPETGQGLNICLSLHKSRYHGCSCLRAPLSSILGLNCPPLSSPSCPTHLEQTPPVFVEFFIKVHKGSRIIYINTRLAVQGPVLSFDAA